LSRGISGGLDGPTPERQTGGMIAPGPVRSILVLALTAAVGAACGDRPDEPPAQGAARADTVVVVPLHGLALRVEPGDSAPATLDVAAGTPLRLLEARDGWLRLATWDDRAGWAAESGTVELPLWVHYQRALGGAPLSDLRPGYPLGDGRWGVEAPPPSPGVVTSANVWVLGPEPLVGSVAATDVVPSSCGGAYRFGFLAEPPTGRVAGDEPLLERARLVATAAPGSSLRMLEPLPATPDPIQVQAVRRLADSLGTAGRGARFAAAEWLSLGDDALWVTLAGEPGREQPDAPSWAAAAVVLGGGSEPEVRLVVLPHPSPGLPPAIRPVLAFSTTGDGRPTLFVVHRVDYDGQRIELYVARSRDVRAFYRGYAWGC
jgi:hypothetical protein